MFTPSLSFRSLAVFTTLVALNPFGIYAKAVPRLFDARQDPAPSDSSIIVAPGQPLGRFLNCSLGIQKILGDTFNTSDGCLALLNTVTEKSPANDVSLFQFYAVNPEINGDCTNLEDNYNYCLDSNATNLLDINFEPVPAASVPKNSTYSAICSEFYKLAGEDCIRLQEMFQISGDQFSVLNAENINGNTDCDHLVPDSHVCVRPTNIKVYNANITLSGFLAFNRTSTDTSGTDPSPSETSSVSDSATSLDQIPTDTASQGTDGSSASETGPDSEAPTASTTDTASQGTDGSSVSETCTDFEASTASTTDTASQGTDDSFPSQTSGSDTATPTA